LLVAVDGEIRQLVEVKLNVVQAPASHVLPSDGMIDIEAKEINDLAADTSCLTSAALAATRATISNSSGGFGSFLGPGGGGSSGRGDPVKTTLDHCRDAVM
jgi:hypothetical protein